MEVVTGDSSGSGMRAKGGGGKEVLSAPLPWRVGILAGQGCGHVHPTGTDGQVPHVLFADLVKMLAQAVFQSHGQRNNAVLAALAIVDGDGSLVKVRNP